MKFARLGPAGNEIPAVIDADGTARDLRGVTDDIDGAFLSGAASTLDAAAVAALPALPDADALRRGAPVARPGKVVCIGLNYRDHAAETGADIPTEPIVFMKDPTTVIGPDDEVLVPRGSVKTDWEVELAIVIGSTARYCASEQEAAACIAGYAIANDVSEREFQIERGGQWDKGKSCETFNPLGPWLVTPDEVADGTSSGGAGGAGSAGAGTGSGVAGTGSAGGPRPLALRLSVNGEVQQDGTTANMIFGAHEIVRYLSQFMVLHPGDVVNTGTPAGVALAGHHPYLVPGDVVELSIEGLGTQRQTMGAAS
jgi:2-keto-4-pentenoate hydratase/2-oxohepta-3-ene-1,7-dioic acid hydratase in catechol pathway